MKNVALAMLLGCATFVPALAKDQSLNAVRSITVDDVYKLEAGMLEKDVIAMLGRPWGRHEEPRPHNQPDVKDLKQCMIYPVAGHVGKKVKPRKLKKPDGQTVRYAIAVVLRDGKVVEWGRYGTDYIDGSFCHINSGLL